MSSYNKINLSLKAKSVLVAAVIVFIFTATFFSLQRESEICYVEMGDTICRPVTAEDRSIQFLICIIPITIGLIIIVSYLLLTIIRKKSWSSKTK
ncbi:MAG: hypothetical protein ACFE96_09950 [Candidatus Hermodarchaeota archaeon]